MSRWKNKGKWHIVSQLNCNGYLRIECSTAISILGTMDKKLTNSRRKVILQLACVSGIGSIDRWTKPVVESVILPAHAQTTNVEVEEDRGPSTPVRSRGNFSGNGALPDAI